MSEAAKETIKEASPLTVLYDGACPLCRREIGVYRGLQPLHSDSPVCFADVNDTALPLPPGTTREQLLARFHVRGRDGALLSGVQAFLALWAALPAGAGWRWPPSAGCGLVDGGWLPTLPALAADVAALGVSSRGACAGTAEPSRRRLVTKASRSDGRRGGAQNWYAPGRR